VTEDFIIDVYYCYRRFVSRSLHRIHIGKSDPFSLISRLPKKKEKERIQSSLIARTNHKKKKKMGKWRDEPMNTGGAAAAPYQRAANDECRICGGEKKRVARALFDFFFPAKIFFLSLFLALTIFFLLLSLALCCVRSQALVTGKRS